MKIRAPESSTILMVLITALGLAERVALLGSDPPALNSDELLKTFDGASVYRTGYDHHGHGLPLFFQQSGEYSPPLYIYFSGIFSTLFGIHPMTVRLPSALLGTLSLVLTFLLVRQFASVETALWAAGLAAVSPWNVFYSRIGWEAILQTPLQLLGLAWFFQWTRTRRLLHLWLSTGMFALTFYAYPTARLFTPLLLVGMVWIFRRELFDEWRSPAICATFFFLCLGPYINELFRTYHAMQARWMFLSVFHMQIFWKRRTLGK